MAVDFVVSHVDVEQSSSATRPSSIEARWEYANSGHQPGQCFVAMLLGDIVIDLDLDDAGTRRLACTCPVTPDAHI